MSVFNSVAKYLYSDLSDEKTENHLLDELVEEGNNGISTGKGFYEYQESDLVNEEKTRDAMILGILKTEKEFLTIGIIILWLGILALKYLKNSAGRCADGIDFL